MSRIVDIKGSISISNSSDIGGNAINIDVDAGIAADYTITHPDVQGADGYTTQKFDIQIPEATISLDSTDLNLNNNDTVTTWGGQTATGTPTYLTNQTPNGRPAVEFNGTDRMANNFSVTASAANDWIIVAVLKPTNTGSYINIVDDDNSNNPMLWVDSSFRYEFNTGGGTEIDAGNGPDGWDIVIGNSKNNRLYVNSGTSFVSGGGAKSFTTTGNYDFFHRDGAQTYKGLVAELKIYNDMATISNINNIYNKMYNKWFTRSNHLKWKENTTRRDLAKLMFNPFATSHDTTTISGLTGTTKWFSGVLAPNGKIYCVPLSSSSVLIIDPSNDTTDTTTITGLSGTFNWIGGVLAPNGKIYCIPNNTTDVLIIDPSNGTADTTTISGLSGSTQWYGGVLAPNGKIYCIPRNSTSVLIIDPSNDTPDTSTISGLSGTIKWYGGVLAPNGKIYCIPSNSTSVLIIDPSNDTSENTSITGLSGTNKWFGGVLAPNGKIYCVPNNSTSVLRIDPSTNDTTTIITGLSGTSKWNGGVLAPNGKIYCVPLASTSVLIIDPETDTPDTSTISGFAVGNKWHTGILATNGKIYSIPRDSTTVLIIPTGEPTIPIQRCISAFYNKF